MKIVVVSSFYSKGMGYSENNLPKALAALGHEVHVLTSDLNVYGNSSDYDLTYKSFLGSAYQEQGVSEVDGYTLHRLPSKQVFGYVYIRNLYKTIREISPDIVHSTALASLNCYKLALIKPICRFKLFAENHQHLSVIKPFLRERGNLMKKIVYKLTRTIPSYLSGLQVEKCYAIAPDCIEVANRYYGIPLKKIALQPLGTDTILFSPMEEGEKLAVRSSFGYNSEDLLCVYTGRFSKDKNPLLLARAIDAFAETNETPKVCGLFIGEGLQKEQIEKCRNVRIMPFMKHNDLATYYKIADIGVWPMQESMSMLDAAATGLALIVSDDIGEKERVNGNGEMYKQGEIGSLMETIKSLSDKKKRISYSGVGREKMLASYSWLKVAERCASDFSSSLKENK